MFLPFALPSPPIVPPDPAHRIVIVRPWEGPVRPQPDTRPRQGAAAVEIKLLTDTGPADPQWRQTFSITINRGGSLTEAADRLFGDPSEENVNRLFEAARRKYPNLQDPGKVTAGQQFTIEIDPTRTFILTGVERLTNPDRTVRKFTNGAVETRYAAPQRGITRVIDFPAEGARELEFHDGKEAIRVPGGSTLVNYEYQAGQSFEEVVQATYGQRSQTAMADFQAKTGWRPQAWPPESGASKQILVSRQTNYADERINRIRVAVPDPAWQEKIDRAAEDRAAVGIYAIGNDADSTRYLVRIVRPDVTVDQVAKLLYEKPKEHRDEILQAARLPGNEQAAGEGGAILQGSRFELDVPFAAEPIVARQGNEVRLADGTRLVGSDRSLIADYPSGYRELRYVPDKWIAFLANAYELAWETLRDPGAPKETLQQRADRAVGQLLWQWDPSNPRRTAGEVAESVTFVGGRPGRIAPDDVEVRALLKPPDRVTRGERLEAELRRYPFLIPVAGLIALAAVGILLSLILRLTRRFRTPRATTFRAIRRRRGVHGYPRAARRLAGKL